MSPQFSLARAREDRIGAYQAVFQGTAIWARYFASGGGLENTLRRAIHRGELWCAHTEADTLAGVMRVVPRGFCGLYHYLALIGTAPAARGLGAGRFLMESFEEMARRDGCLRTSLLVSDFNRSALAFYQALGYWELGAIPDAVKPGIGEHVLLKDL